MDAGNDEADMTGSHEPALPAFAINIEFVKRLVLAQGTDNFRPQAVAEIRTWMALQIDGAQGYLDVSEEEEGRIPEIGWCRHEDALRAAGEPRGGWVAPCVDQRLR